jgi:hypothetical protein
MAQRLRTERADGKVTISCLVSDLEFRWQLREATAIQVRVKLPEKKRAGRELGERSSPSRSTGRTGYRRREGARSHGRGHHAPSRYPVVSAFGFT